MVKKRETRGKKEPATLKPAEGGWGKENYPYPEGPAFIECEEMKCVGCGICQMACSMYHFGVINKDLARIQVRKYLLPLVDVIAYCLMPTHYHFLVRIKTRTSEVTQIPKTKTSEVSVPDISRSMQRFSISYTKAINKRFDRVGSLFQGAFQARSVQSEKYLLQLCRYIHANPVKDGLVGGLNDWPFSNYLEWIGEREGTLFDHDFVQEHFPNPAGYIEYVMDYLLTRDLPEEILRFLMEFE